jgi:hypothetical protein
MKDRKVKQLLSMEDTTGRGRAKEKVKKGEYGGYILYSYMKIEQ